VETNRRICVTTTLPSPHTSFSIEIGEINDSVGPRQEGVILGILEIRVIIEGRRHRLYMIWVNNQE
jgi:hypothetical protein